MSPIDPNLITLIKKLNRKSRTRFIIVALMTLGVGGVMIYAPQFDDTMGTAGSIASMIIGSFFVIVGLLMVYVAVRRSRLIGALNQSPETIVWVFRQNVVMQNGAQTNTANVNIKFSDGKTEVLTLGPKQADTIMEGLQKNLKKTHFGYSKEIEAQFMKSPQSLMK